jgi:hypothetical protein
MREASFAQKGGSKLPHSKGFAAANNNLLGLYPLTEQKIR